MDEDSGRAGTGSEPRLKEPCEKQIEDIFLALGDRTRRQIVERVSEGPVTVSELARPFALTLAAVLQHVQALERSGLVRTEKQGRVRLVRLNGEGLEVLRAWLNSRGGAWEMRLERLGNLLGEKPRN